jgi:hypothetical protein
MSADRQIARPASPQARLARRRWFGLLHLIIAGGMLIWGLTLLREVLRGWLFVAYWLACLGFTLLAILYAWLDLRAIRRRARQERQELRARTAAAVVRELQPPGPGSNRPPKTP